MREMIDFKALKYERNEYAKLIRKDYEKGSIKVPRHKLKDISLRKDGICNTITSVQKDNYILEIHNG